MAVRRYDFSFLDKDFLENEFFVLEKGAKQIMRENGIDFKHYGIFLNYIRKLGFKDIFRERARRLIGKKFNLLIVKDIVIRKELPNNRRIWLSCQCDCGMFTLLERYRIETTLSCGCRGNSKLKKKHNCCWKGCGEISGTYFASTRFGAKKRNLEFSITISQIWDLFVKQNKRCALTGMELIFSDSTQKSDCNNTTASLDRIDSSKGYIDGNIQWVHKDVNRMKQEFSQEYFVDICKMIYLHNNKGN